MTHAQAPIITATHGAQRPYGERVRYAARQGQPFPLPDTGSPYHRRAQRAAMHERIADAARTAWAQTFDAWIDAGRPGPFAPYQRGVQFIGAADVRRTV